MRAVFITTLVVLSAANANACDLAFTTGQQLPVEVAVTLPEQAKGLSGRDLNDPHSMLFVWSEEAPRVFWMQNTDQDLEVGFFGDDLRLFAVEHMTARTTNYHYSPRPARLALELKAGDFQRLQLGIGSQLAISGCLAR
jgi:uncharacterized membrane protein (UPF0127 family)